MEPDADIHRAAQTGRWNHLNQPVYAETPSGEIYVMGQRLCGDDKAKILRELKRQQERAHGQFERRHLVTNTQTSPTEWVFENGQTGEERARAQRAIANMWAKYEAQKKPSGDEMDSEFHGIFYTIAVTNWETTKAALSDSQVFALVRIGLDEVRNEMGEIIRQNASPDGLKLARDRFLVVSDEWMARLQRQQTSKGGDKNLPAPSIEKDDDELKFRAPANPR